MGRGLLKGFQYGGQVAFSGIQNGILKDPTTDPLPQWQIPKVDDGKKGNHPELKKSDYGTTQFLNIGPKGLRDVYNNDLKRLRDRVHENAIKYRNGEISIDDFYQSVDDVALKFKGYEGELKTYDDQKKVLDKNNQKNSGKLFYVDKNKVLASALFTEDGKIADKDYSGKVIRRVIPVNPTNDDERIKKLTYNEAVEYFEKTHDRAAVDLIGNKASFVTSSEEKNKQMTQMANSLGDITTITGKGTIGGKPSYFYKSFKINNYEFSAKDLKQATVLNTNDAIRFSTTTSAKNAFDYVKDITTKMDDKVYNVFVDEALTKDNAYIKGDTSFYTQLDDFDTYGKTKGSDNNAYESVLKNIFIETSMFAKPSDIDGVVDRLLQNNEFKGYIKKREKLNSAKDARDYLINKFEPLAKDNNSGYSLDKPLTKEQQDMYSARKLNEVVRTNIVNDIFQKLDVKASVSRSKEGADNSGGGKDPHWSYYSGINLTDANDVLNSQFSKISKLTYTNSSGKQELSGLGNSTYDLRINKFKADDVEKVKNSKSLVYMDKPGNESEFNNNAQISSATTMTGDKVDTKDVIMTGEIAMAYVPVNDKGMPTYFTGNGALQRLLNATMSNTDGYMGDILNKGKAKYKEIFDNQDISKDEMVKAMMFDKYLVHNFDIDGSYYKKDGNKIVLKDDVPDKAIDINAVIDSSGVTNIDFSADKKFRTFFQKLAPSVGKRYDIGTTSDITKETNKIKKFYSKQLNKLSTVKPKVMAKGFKIYNSSDLIKDGHLTSVANMKISDPKYQTSKYYLTKQDDFMRFYNSLSKEAKSEMNNQLVKSIRELSTLFNNTDYTVKAYDNTVIGEIAKKWKDKINPNWLLPDNKFQDLLQDDSDDEMDGKMLSLILDFSSNFVGENEFFFNPEKNTEFVAERASRDKYTKDSKERITSTNTAIYNTVKSKEFNYNLMHY